jgi:hypothetical protein
MKNIFITVLGILLVFSCANKKDENLTINGHIKGLKKGTLYLQKIEDTLLVNIDSLIVKGNSDFSFSTSIPEPEILYLQLDKNDGIDVNDRLEFFAEKGLITINTTVDNFEVEAKIEGSETQKKLEDYKKILASFMDKNLNYVKENLDAQIARDTLKADSISILADKNTLRTYQFVINYALQNKNSYIAPYITLTKANNITLKYLDTVNNSLTPEIAKSKYGIELNKYVQEVRSVEK